MNIYLVGIVRDQAQSIQRNLEHLMANLQQFGNIFVHIVESDSSDETVAKLQEFAKKYPRFSFESNGKLVSIFPNRIARIRYCRIGTLIF